MSYTNGLDKPTDYFNTKLYTGNGSTQSISSVGFQPDWVWLKNRQDTDRHCLFDNVRGVEKVIFSHLTGAEQSSNLYGTLTSFDSDGFSLLNGSNSAERTNVSGENYVSWNWLAGGTAPAITYSVKVVSDSGNKYRFDDFGTSAVTLDLQEGGTYTFDQSDSSNSGHPLRFSTTSDGTHGGGSEYTTNVTTTGTPGSAGAKTVITVASGTATLYYYCSVHSGMGGQANTNSTFGSSNFSGSIQSTVSANTTAGFSIVSYTGNGTLGATVGHGLGSAPSMVLVKRRNTTGNWWMYHDGLGGADKYIVLNSTSAIGTSTNIWNNTEPTSNVFSLGDNANYPQVNGTSDTFIAYCFAEKKGYSKFGSYTGNGSTDGTYIHLGFKPAWFLVKKSSASGNYWMILDNKRNTFNVVDQQLYPNSNDADTHSDTLDFVSNGIKIRYTGNNANTSGATFIYMAFAENPFVTSTGIPTTAR